MRARSPTTWRTPSGRGPTSSGRSRPSSTPPGSTKPRCSSPARASAGRLRVPVLEPLPGRRVPASGRRAARLLRRHAPHDRSGWHPPRSRQGRDEAARGRRLQRHRPPTGADELASSPVFDLPPLGARSASSSTSRAVRGRLARPPRQLPALAGVDRRHPHVRAHRPGGLAAGRRGARPARGPSARWSSTGPDCDGRRAGVRGPVEHGIRRAPRPARSADASSACRPRSPSTGRTPAPARRHSVAVGNSRSGDPRRPRCPRAGRVPSCLGEGGAR